MNVDALNKATKGNTRTNGVSDFSELPLDKVYPNPKQPRKHFGELEIDELALQIRRDGLLQPIVVAKRPNGYMIIAGERRYRAHLWIHAQTIKAHIIVADDHKVQELSLVENIQRTDLTDLEIAMFIDELWKSGKYENKAQLAETIGKSQSYLSKCFSALKLDDEILDDIKETKQEIPVSVLDEISRVKEPETRKEVYNKYKNKEIVRSDIKDYKNEKEIEVQHLNGNDEKAYLTTHTGTLVNLRGYKGIVCEEEDGNFRVLELKSGIELSCSCDRDEAIESARGTISSVPDAIAKTIDKVIALKNQLLGVDAPAPKKKSLSQSLKEVGEFSPEKKELEIEPGVTHSAKKPLYQTTSNIEVIKSTIKKAVDCGYRIDNDNKLRTGHNKEKDFVFIDNDYERAIYDLYVELRDVTDKEIFIISYQAKKGSHHGGGGHRVRAINKADALEQGREHYSEYAKDSNYFFIAEPLRGYESNPRFSSPVGYGFGTKNDEGTFVTIVDGDFKGTFTFRKGGEFIKTTNNKEYKVIIEEV